MVGLPNGETIATAGNRARGSDRRIIGAGTLFLVVRDRGSCGWAAPHRKSPCRGFMQPTWRAAPSDHVVEAHTRSILMQFQHVSACNGLHSVEARIGPVAAHLHDRTDDNNMGGPIMLIASPQTLSHLLGVRTNDRDAGDCQTPRLGAIISHSAGLGEIDRARPRKQPVNATTSYSRATDRIVPHEAVGSAPAFCRRPTNSTVYDRFQPYITAYRRPRRRSRKSAMFRGNGDDLRRTASK